MAAILSGGGCRRGAHLAYTMGYGIMANRSAPRSMITAVLPHPTTPFAFLRTTTSAARQPAVAAALRRRGLSSSSSPKKEPTDGANASSTHQESAAKTSWWETFTAPKPMPPRYTALWYREMILVCTVFAITGSTTMVVVRPAVSEGLGIRGSLKEGPWSYRICSLVIMSPLYGLLLIVVGTVFGRHAYFRHFTVKMFSRFGIPPELMDANFHTTSKNFRKW